jgi:nucleoside-diphosphate-sugar epimerase
VPIGDISTVLDWTPLLQGIDTVVHLASPALSPDEEDALPRFREVNVECTRRLAQGASAAGVRKFIFLSSLKVHGERSLGRPIREDDPRCPADAYAISKVEAEDALRDVSRETGLNVITLRPPAVYGPGARGNILRLLRLISRGIPLPLGSIANQRSLIYMDNLVDAIIACIDATPRPHCTYLVSDGEDVSTPDLVRRLAAALGVPARLVPCPVALLKLGARVMGRSADIGRLTESLQLDCSRIRDELGWKPPHSLAHGLQATARSFQQREEHTPIEMGAADRARARR